MNEPGRNGHTPAAHLVKQSDDQLLKVLLGANVNPNQMQYGSWRLLSLAIAENQVSSVHLLLAAKASVHNKWGFIVSKTHRHRAALWQ